MSSNVSGDGRALTALVVVALLGLCLPGLAAALRMLGLGGSTLLSRLLIYELLLCGLALAVALGVLGLVPGSTPGPFSRGVLDAGVSPIPWLGLGNSPQATWRRELASLLLVITLVTTVFVYLARRGNFSWHDAAANAGWILLFAALNAAGEEWLYRVALLRAADSLMSGYAACLLSAGLFGAAHLQGMPEGWSGALAASVLGLVLSRATLDTGGIAPAWGVHFVQDIVIFAGWLGSTSAARVAAGS